MNTHARVGQTQWYHTYMNTHAGVGATQGYYTYMNNWILTLALEQHKDIIHMNTYARVGVPHG